MAPIRRACGRWLAVIALALAAGLGTPAIALGQDGGGDSGSAASSGDSGSFSSDSGSLGSDSSSSLGSDSSSLGSDSLGSDTSTPDYSAPATPDYSAPATP